MFQRIQTTGRYKFQPIEFLPNMIFSLSSGYTLYGFQDSLIEVRREL